MRQVPGVSPLPRAIVAPHRPRLSCARDLPGLGVSEGLPPHARHAGDPWGRVSSQSGGFSKTRLERMADVMRGYVERGELAGVVTLLSRHDEVHVEAIGAQDLATATPMRRDTIFRIASMTKPITAAAAMILVEEAKLRLDEPVDRLLPELADRKVLKRLDGPLDDTVPAHRSITLRDLLTFRLGVRAVVAR